MFKAVVRMYRARILHTDYIPGYFLGKAMAYFAQLLVISMNFVGVVAVRALPGMHLKMIACPALR